MREGKEKEQEEEEEEEEEANAEDDRVVGTSSPKLVPRQDGCDRETTQLNLLVTPVHSRLRMQELANQTVDVWSTCSGPSTRPRGGAEPSRFRGPQA
ncbi:hypothetical protein G5I_05644 [Acromyrmex echinatior]|uniref:Uncharacterized protein n=1 Tax=Acromyrmex echinatior TaxID=103372 RepID=F4WIW8_ACREC|nr:hypothetical protein G5I_05644 [Acromyrmex echinatior]